LRRLFQTRAFIAVALLLLLGAVRCIDACRFAEKQAAAKNCHHDPDAPKKQAAATGCAQLHLLTPDCQEMDAAAPTAAARPFEPSTAPALQSADLAAPSHPPRLFAPLRI